MRGPGGWTTPQATGTPPEHVTRSDFSKNLGVWGFLKRKQLCCSKLILFEVRMWNFIVKFFTLNSKLIHPNINYFISNSI